MGNAENFKTTSTRRDTLVECKKKLPIYFNLLETMWLFKSQNIEEYLEKYKDICVVSLDHNVLKELLEMFVKIDKIYSSPSIIKFYQLYCQLMSNKLSKPPVFSWHMPGRIPEVPLLSSFLQSEKHQMMYQGNFRNITDARKFCQRYENLKDGLSWKMVPSGIGSKAHVDITKTNDYFQTKLNIYNQQVNDLDSFKKRLDTIILSNIVV